MIRSSNPVLKGNPFAQAQVGGDTMTLNGVSMKSGFLLLLLLISASYPWGLFYSAYEVGDIAGATSSVYPLLILGAIGSFVVALITVFVKKAAVFTAPIYALLEGLFIGSISAIVQSQFPEIPIVLQAACLTFLTFGVMLFCYVSRIIKPTQNFVLGIVSATGGIMLLYLVTFVLSFFGITVPFIHDTGPSVSDSASSSPPSPR